MVQGCKELKYMKMYPRDNQMKAQWTQCQRIVWIRFFSSVEFFLLSINLFNLWE